MPIRSAALASVLALVILSLAIPAQSQSATTYGNARFGYVIAYPADLLVPEREADNGDGRQFHARHGTAKMSVWGAYNAEGQSPEEIARNYAGDCGAGKVTYKVAKPRLVAFSCVTPAGRVIYQKTVIRQDVLSTVRFDYPNEERTIWDPVVRKVSGSLSAGSGAD